MKKANYLVCVNGEDYSRVAVRFTSSMAKNNNGSVIILHVIELSDYKSFGTVVDKIREESRENAEILLQSLADMAHNEYGITPVFMVREGLIEEEIMKLIEEDDSINMLVVGADKESASKSKILPPLVSQSGKKLRIPVMIVPGNLSQKEIIALT